MQNEEKLCPCTCGEDSSSKIVCHHKDQPCHLIDTSKGYQCPVPQETNKGWEERFELSFDKKHNTFTHLNEKKKRQECNTCFESKKYNPKGYCKTFLTESKCYWNSEMFDDVKNFISLEIAQAKREVLDEVEKRLPETENPFTDEPAMLTKADIEETYKRKVEELFGTLRKEI